MRTLKVALSTAPENSIKILYLLGEAPKHVGRGHERSGVVVYGWRVSGFQGLRFRVQGLGSRGEGTRAEASHASTASALSSHLRKLCRGEVVKGGPPRRAPACEAACQKDGENQSNTNGALAPAVRLPAGVKPSKPWSSYGCTSIPRTAPYLRAASTSKQRIADICPPMTPPPTGIVEPPSATLLTRGEPA